MIHAELEAWSRWATPESVSGAVESAKAAMAFWQRQFCDPAEQIDLEPWSRGRFIFPEVAAEWGGSAAGELAIICRIWPDSLDDVLRPGRAVRRR